MPGLFFYWIAWAAWVVITFMAEKGKSRTETAIVLLVVIICSNRFFTVEHIAINASLVVLLVYGYRKLANLKRSTLFYTVAVCHVVALAYIGFFMYSLYDPAILWLDRKWMMAVLIFLLVQFLAKSFPLRCVTAVIGLVHGNLLLSWIMHGYSLSVEAGSLSFFDLLFICLAMIAIWRGYEGVAHYMDSLFRKTFTQKSHYSK